MASDRLRNIQHYQRPLYEKQQVDAEKAILAIDLVNLAINGKEIYINSQYDYIDPTEMSSIL